jgi:hypothetical protein
MVAWVFRFRLGLKMFVNAFLSSGSESLVSHPLLTEVRQR